MKTNTSRRGKRQEPAITRTPEIRNGAPCIAGTGIRVLDIVYQTQAGYTPDEIADTVYPHLTVAQVKVALAFYESNRPEIDEYIRRDEEFFRTHVNPPVPRRKR